MANVESSASFICAVLEQAGYQAQSLFLDQLRDFFREGGGFIYVLAAAGAVFSVANFGSFRAARYLLVGPVLFWFLVGPRQDYDGVKWQIGGGNPRGVQDRRGEGASLTDVRTALVNAGMPNNPIKVAKGFALFARTINGLVKDLVDVMLKDEDGEYLMHLSRTRGLDYIMASVPYDPVVYEMLEGNLTKDCPDFLEIALSLSARDVQPEVIQSLGAAGANAQARRNFYQQQFDSYADNRYVVPNTQTRNVMQVYGQRLGIDPNANKVSCRNMWRLLADYLRDHADAITTKVLRLAKGDGTDEESACAFLMDKLGTGQGQTEGACREQLRNAITCYMLKNITLDGRTMTRFIRRLLNDRETAGRTPNGFLVPLASLPNGMRFGQPVSGTSTRLIGGRSNLLGNVLGLMGLRTPGPQSLEGAVFSVRTPIDPAIARDGPAGGNSSTWSPVARLMAIGSSYDASFVELPKYNLKEMRQRLFSWALNVPYWQGVIIYFLAVLYPFFALIVLVPGKAHHFLNLPLAWLWVKSWDVGMASVMVFDRVLWNMFPKAMLSSEVRQTPLSQLQFYQAVTETMKGDQTWNMNLHYTLLSIATLAIPSVTGMAILKARRSMLSSFTDKLISDAKTAGNMLAGAYGTQVMQDRVRAMREVGALAAMSVGQGGMRPANPAIDGAGATGWRGGFGGDGRHERAALFGGIAAAGPIAENNLFAKKNMMDWTADQTRAAAGFVRGYAKSQEAEVMYERAYRQAFDPVLGRWGEIRMRMQAFAASQDKSGGFEIDDYQGMNASKEFIDLFTTKMEMTLKSLNAAARGWGAKAAAAVPAGTEWNTEGWGKGLYDSLITKGLEAAKKEKDPNKARDAFVAPLADSLFGNLEGMGIVKDKAMLTRFLADSFHITPENMRWAANPTFTYNPGVSASTWEWDKNAGELGPDGKRKGDYVKRELSQFELMTTLWMVDESTGGNGSIYSRHERHYRVPDAQMFWDISARPNAKGEFDVGAPFHFDADQMVGPARDYYFKDATHTALGRLRGSDARAWQDGVVVRGQVVIDAIQLNPNMTLAEAKAAYGGLYDEYRAGVRKFYTDHNIKFTEDDIVKFDAFYASARRPSGADANDADRKRFSEILVKEQQALAALEEARAGLGARPTSDAAAMKAYDDRVAAAAHNIEEQRKKITAVTMDYENAVGTRLKAEFEGDIRNAWHLPLLAAERDAAIKTGNKDWQTWWTTGVEYQRSERIEIQKQLRPVHIGPNGFGNFDTPAYQMRMLRRNAGSDE